MAGRGNSGIPVGTVERKENARDNNRVKRGTGLERGKGVVAPGL